jgi:hypothetical protein
MAPAFVQAVGSTQLNPASPTVSFGSNVSAGNAIIVYGGSYLSGTTISSVTDNLGNLYTEIPNGSGIHANITWSIWATFSITGGACTVTVNYGSGSSNARIAIAEYSGVSSFDQTSNEQGLASSGPTAISSGNVTTTSASEMLVGIGFINNDGAVFTPGTGFSLDLNNVDTTLSTLLFIEDMAVSSIGSYAATGSFTGSFFGWSLALVTLVGAAVIPPTGSFNLQGNAGVPFASVSLTGTATATVTADANGTYTFENQTTGTYTITPTLATYTFTPTTHSETITTADIYGINFTAVNASAATSVIDSRPAPNSTVDIEDTQFYIPANPPSHLLPVDSRAAGAPVDSRISIPENSRTEA